MEEDRLRERKATNATADDGDAERARWRGIHARRASQRRAGSFAARARRGGSTGHTAGIFFYREHIKTEGTDATTLIPGSSKKALKARKGRHAVLRPPRASSELRDQKASARPKQ